MGPAISVHMPIISIIHTTFKGSLISGPFGTTLENSSLGPWTLSINLTLDHKLIFDNLIVCLGNEILLFLQKCFDGFGVLLLSCAGSVSIRFQDASKTFLEYLETILGELMIQITQIRDGTNVC
jgi:hypothetical protein